ncbi:hypothetical protein C8Q80DRAFT_1273630 [Daedaleopsis nitida]|nr:hypothetical protein C8Q80DRAFT_1273630 [Daedaleopsis nitida]
MVFPVIPSLLLAVAALSSSAVAHPNAHDAINAALPGTWHHPEDHPVRALFRRGDDGATYPAVGTPEWSAGLPTWEDDEKGMPTDGKGYPQVWIDALNAAVKAGNIPDIPPSTLDPTGFPKYADGLDPNGPVVCSATYKCRSNDSSEIWDAPDGVFASSFDDGPLPTSIALYNFLKQNNVTSTHFMIGGNIRDNPDAFKLAFDDLQSDIAVHTWTHPYMTTLTNLQVVGELGWTMKLIHDSTGGRVPKYWRPPFGDSDERVLAIAKNVFGLNTVIWNQEPHAHRANPFSSPSPLLPATPPSFHLPSTEDWSIGEANGATRPGVDANLKKWISGAKSPGLIILEHELTNDTVGAFMQAFPLIAQNGWNFKSLARMNSDTDPIYQNAVDDTGDVTPMTVGGPAAAPPAASTSSSSGAATGAAIGAAAPSASGSATGSAPAASGSGKVDSKDNGAGSFASPATWLVSVVAAAAFALA